jgi:phage tail tape-measure protein
LTTEEIMATANRDLRDDKDANRDPISGSPGAHPVGVGVGAAGAGAAGAAIGAVGGPIGAAVGAVVGAVAGGLAGKGVAESVNPTEEDAYWRENYKGKDYVERDIDYDRDLAPAYRAGYTPRPSTVAASSTRSRATSGAVGKRPKANPV